MKSEHHSTLFPRKSRCDSPLSVQWGQQRQGVNVMSNVGKKGNIAEILLVVVVIIAVIWGAVWCFTIIAAAISHPSKPQVQFVQSNDLLAKGESGLEWDPVFKVYACPEGQAWSVTGIKHDGISGECIRCTWWSQLCGRCGTKWSTYVCWEGETWDPAEMKCRGSTERQQDRR